MTMDSDSGLFSSITEYSEDRKQIALSVAAEEESENPISIDVYAYLRSNLILASLIFIILLNFEGQRVYTSN